MLYLAHTFSLLLTIAHQFFLILGVSVGTLRVGYVLFFTVYFSRACSSMALDVVGIGLGVGAVGAGGWFCRRFVIRSICCFAWSLTVAAAVVCSDSVAAWSDACVCPWLTLGSVG